MSKEAIVPEAVSVAETSPLPVEPLDKLPLTIPRGRGRFRLQTTGSSHQIRTSHGGYGSGNGSWSEHSGGGSGGWDRCDECGRSSSSLHLCKKKVIPGLNLTPLQMSIEMSKNYLTNM